MNRIVLLDAKTLGSDLDLTCFERFGQVTIYPYTRPEQVLERSAGCNVVICNKVVFTEREMRALPQLELICVTATGTNNIDLQAAARLGIAVCNIKGYSTESVAQHTFAMLFYLLEHSRYYDEYVKSGAYTGDEIFTHFAKIFHELSALRWGIVGLGAIGRRVAQLAALFGARVMYYSTTGLNASGEGEYTRVDKETLLRESDILSIHAPLNEQTKDFLRYEELCQMKPTAILLNLGRGGIVREADLAKALEEGRIAAAGLDVLEQEPIQAENPLLRIQDSDRLFITPHIAWASIEARNRMTGEIMQNMESYFAGGRRNRVDG